MGTGYTRNDTTNNIANGNVISAADLDGEFDAVVAAFANTTGHTHDGTTAEGGAVTVLGPVQEYLGDGTAFYPKTTAVYTLGKASNVWSNLYLNTLTLGGTAVTSTAAELNKLDGYTGTFSDLNKIAAVTATAAELNKLDGYTGTFSDLNKIAAVTATAAELNVLDGVAATLTFTELNYVDGVTSAIQTQLDNKQPLSAVLTATTASFLLADETKLDAIEALADVTDAINVTAAGALMDSELTNLAAVKAINQSLVTTASPTFNQGNFTTVDTASLEVTTLKARDGVAAGGIASGTGVTTLNSAILTTADINGGTIDNTSIGATTRSTGLFTTLGTNGLATLASVDINGGNIDGTVIGAATPATVRTSSLVATTADINGGTIDGTIIGGTTSAAGTFTDLTVNGNAYPSLGALSNRNLIVNGDISVAQRPTRAIASYAVPFYAGPDRWLVARSGTGNTGFSQIADTNFGRSFAAQATFECAATESWNVQQRIEGRNIAHLQGQKVTLSFYVSGASTAGSSTMFAALNSANAVDNFSVDTEIANFSVAYTGTATKFTFTFTLPASAVNGVSVVLRGVKTTATGTFTLKFGGMQLEAGDTATPFEYRSYGQELSLCRRYFRRWGYGTTNGRLGHGGFAGSTSAEIMADLDPQMRGVPTMSAPNKGQILDYGVSWHAITTVTLAAETTPDMICLNAIVASSGASQGDACALGGGGSAFDYLFDAEL